MAIGVNDPVAALRDAGSSVEGSPAALVSRLSAAVDNGLTMRQAVERAHPEEAFWYGCALSADLTAAMRAACSLAAAADPNRARILELFGPNVGDAEWRVLAGRWSLDNLPHLRKEFYERLVALRERTLDTPETMGAAR